MIKDNLLTKRLCIFGTGGFGKEVLGCYKDIIEANGVANFNVCFMVEDEYFSVGEVAGVEVIRLSEFKPDLHNVVIAVGDPLLRRRIVTKLPEETSYATLIHPTVVISNTVSVGNGSVICAGCILTCDITLGVHTHLNLGTTIGHDCVCGDYFTTAPGCNISGNCRIGNNVYLGTAASLREKVQIFDNVVVGMGGIVLKDITKSGTYVGFPVREMTK